MRRVQNSQLGWVCLGLSVGAGIALVAAALLHSGRASAQDADLGKQAEEILKKNCFRCHGENGSKKGKVDYILDRDLLVAKKKVRIGEPPEESGLYKRVLDGEMPPESEKPRPTPAEVEILKKWVAAGAPPFAAAKVDKPDTKPDTKTDTPDLPTIDKPEAKTDRPDVPAVDKPDVKTPDGKVPDTTLPPDLPPPEVKVPEVTAPTTKTPDATTDAGGPALAAKAHEVLKLACFRCHGKDNTVDGGMNYVLNREKLISGKKLTPGDPEKSRLYKRLKGGEMPPEGETPRPSAAEIETVRKWIESGAPDFAAAKPKRDFITNEQVFEFIRADLGALQGAERRFARYFTLTHLYNAGASDEDMESHRQALSKLCNSVSWADNVFVPQPIDPNKTVVRIDLRRYGWTHQTWDKIFWYYPYGFTANSQAARYCYEATEHRLPVVRGDWFTAFASRPPLYHDLLGIPDQDHELQRMLGIHVDENIRRSLVIRAGFNGSGVSRNNRMIERHDTRYGAGWWSYDFAENAGRKNLFAFPLGPGDDRYAFQHDGGEIIFNLPNGLQAYMLVDNKGKRIDKGPVAIVSDPKRPDRAVENGVSCMSCHQRGMIYKLDQIRPHVDANPNAFGLSEAIRIKSLYAPEARYKELIEADGLRFKKALELAGGNIDQADPVMGLTLKFEAELDLPIAAAEVGLTPDEFKDRLSRSALLSRILGPLNVEGGTVQRQVFNDGFKDIVHELGLGVYLDPKYKPPAVPESKTTQYQASMNAGYAATAENRYGDAVIQFRIALSCRPGDVGAARVLYQAESKTDVYKDKLVKYQGCMSRGREAYNARRWQDAIREFTEAYGYFESDRNSYTLLKQAESGYHRERWEREQYEHRRAEYGRYMQAGRAAYEARQYVVAVRCFNDALIVIPGDAEANRWLGDSRKHSADGERRLGVYRDCMNRGYAAMSARRWDDARREFGAALVQIAGDADATRLLRDVDAAADAARKDRDNRFADYKKYMNLGHVAIRDKQYRQASVNYGQALRLVPGDLEASAAIREADRLVRDDDNRRKVDDYAKHLRLAREATTARKWQDAAKHYRDCLSARPGDPVAARELRQAEDASAAEEKKLDGYRRHMNSGRSAFNAKRWDDAIREFQAALAALPGDANAGDLLAKSEAGKKGGFDDKRDAEYVKLMNQGNGHLKARRYAEALPLYRDALALKPGDAGANSGIKQCQDALAVIGKKDDKKQKDTAAYQDLMGKSRAALKTGRFDDAARDAQAAAQLFPGDRTSSELLKDIDAERKRALGDQKTAAEYNRLMAAGRAAMSGKRYSDAVQAYRDALALHPNDPPATRGLKDAQDEIADAGRREKSLASYKDLMGKSRTALKAGRFDDAARDAQAAGQLFPGDKNSAGLLQEINAARAKSLGDSKGDAEYNRLIGAARTAFNARRFDEAAKGYRAALALKPNDPTAGRGVKDSQEALADLLAKDKAAKDKFEKDKLEKDKLDKTKAAAAYQQAMNRARQALAAGRLDEAARDAQNALQLSPNDRDAAGLLRDIDLARQKGLGDQKKTAEYNRHMNAGNAAINARRWGDAIREYRDALQLRPNDPTASSSLKQAQDAQALQDKADKDKALKDKLEKDKLEKDKLDKTKAAAAAFGQALARARAAFAAGRLDEAARDAQNALQLSPNDRDAANLLRDIDLARQKGLGDQKKTAEYSRHMNVGNAAFAARRWADAIRGYRDALQSRPNDPTANSALKQAMDAQAAQDKADKDKEKKDKLDKDKAAAAAAFGQALARARAAFAAGRLDEAARDAQNALQLSPNDRDAVNLLRDIDAARAKALGDQKKTAEYNRHMIAGNGAFAARRWADAIREYRDALQSRPNDPTANSALKQALDAQAAQDAKDKADKEKRDKAEKDKAAAAAAVQQTLARGRQFLAAGRLDEAARDAQSALQLSPNNRDALALLRDIDVFRQKAVADQKRQADYVRHMNQGQQFLSLRRFPEAMAQYRDALALRPNDPAASSGLKQAQDAALAADKAERDRVEKEKQDKARAAAVAAYQQAIAGARQSFAAGRFDDAIRQAQSALQLIPNDPTASALIRDANAARQKAAADAGRNADYTRAMNTGAAALNRRDFVEAGRSYRTALALRPNDPGASTGVRQADYGRFMELGQAAMKNRKFKDAVKFFQDALTLFPREPNATKALGEAEAALKDPKNKS